MITITSYTVRDTATMQPVTSADTLDAAVDRLQTERLAFLLNPPPDDLLELVITADDQLGQPGAILVHYAAGPQCGGRRPQPWQTHLMRTEPDRAARAAGCGVLLVFVLAVDVVQLLTYMVGGNFR